MDCPQALLRSPRINAGFNTVARKTALHLGRSVLSTRDCILFYFSGRVAARQRSLARHEKSCPGQAGPPLFRNPSRAAAFAGLRPLEV